MKKAEEKKKQVYMNRELSWLKFNERVLEEAESLKLSITLDTLTARILKLSSDSQSGIEPTPLYSRRKPTNGRADPAVAPVTHEIPPDHEFQLFHFVMFCLFALMIKQFLFHPCPNAFTSRIIMTSSPGHCSYSTQCRIFG